MGFYYYRIWVFITHSGGSQVFVYLSLLKLLVVVFLNLCTFYWLENVFWLVVLMASNVVNLYFLWLKSVCLLVALLSLMICDAIVQFFVGEQFVEFLNAPFFYKKFLLMFGFNDFKKNVIIIAS
jgi:hypothetical protein